MNELFLYNLLTLSVINLLFPEFLTLKFKPFISSVFYFPGCYNNRLNNELLTFLIVSKKYKLFANSFFKNVKIFLFFDLFLSFF